MKTRNFYFSILYVCTVSLYASDQSHPDIMRVINDTTVVPVQLDKKIAANIAFMEADIKYDGENFKICELGNANEAATHKHATPMQFHDKKIHLTAPYWPFLWHYLKQLNLPVWYLGEHPKSIKRFSSFRHDKFCWDLYENMLGGMHANSFADLMSDKHFTKIAQDKKLFDPTKINTYKGIIFCRGSRWIYDKTNFKKKHPEFLIINEATWNYGRCKACSAKLFNGNGLEMFKPVWSLFSVNHLPGLANRIISTIPGKNYVLKPTQTCLSRGVHITDVESLEQTLRHGLRDLQRDSGSYPCCKGKNRQFIVEQYCPSKIIPVGGKRYEPTMRLFFMMRYDDGNIHATPVGGFWKIPQKSIAEGRSLDEMSITHQQDAHRVALEIEPHDLQHVQEIMRNILPKLYANMLRNNSREF